MENFTESDQLLNATGRRGGRRRRLLATLLCICTLERCAYYLYMADVANVRSSKGSDNGSAAAVTSSYCGVTGDNSSMLGLESSWLGQFLRSAAFLLPAVGGSLADGAFGCVRVLQFACCLYVVGAGLLSLAVYSPPAWMLCSLPVRVFCQGALTVASGLARPCLLSLACEAGLALFDLTALCQIHYLCEAVGQVIGCGLSLAADFTRVPLTGGCLAAALLMVTLSAVASGPERRGWQPDQFHLLGKHRVKRLMLVSMPVILMSTVTVLGWEVNAWEVTHHGARLAGMPRTQRDFLFNSDLLLLIYSATLLASLWLLMLVTWTAPGATAPHTRRIAAGLVLAAAGQAAASGLDFGLDRVTSASSFALFLGFGSVVCLNSASEAATFTTLNEVAILIAPGEMRTYVIGLFTALWGTGFLFSVLVQWVSYAAAGYNPDVYFQSTLPQMYLTLGCVMALATVYFVRVAPKPMSWLVGIEAGARRQEELVAIAEPES